MTRKLTSNRNCLEFPPKRAFLTHKTRELKASRKSFQLNPKAYSNFLKFRSTWDCKRKLHFEASDPTFRAFNLKSHDELFCYSRNSRFPFVTFRLHPKSISLAEIKRSLIHKLDLPDMFIKAQALAFLASFHLISRRPLPGGTR